MIDKVFCVFLLTLVRVTTVFAKCSVCEDGQVMDWSGRKVPAGTTSFLIEEYSCVRVELKAISEFTDEQCVILKNSSAPEICGCSSGSSSNGNYTGSSTVPPEPETIPGVNSLTVVQAQVTLTLISVTGTMDSNTVTKTYDKVLLDFYKTFLNGTAIGVTIRTINQTASELQDEKVLFPLNTTVNITASVDYNAKWTFSNFSSFCSNVTINNSDVLMELLKAADVAGNTTFFTDIEKISATETSQVTSVRIVKKKEGYILAGILVTILAILFVAVYVGDRWLKGVEARHEREHIEAVTKEKLKELPQA